MKKTLLSALLLAAALPLAASAAEKSYTFVEAGYISLDTVADGAYVSGNYAFGKSGVYLTGGYSSVEIDNTDIDVRRSDLGLGYRYALNDRFDLNGELARSRFDTDLGDSDGYRASIGTRFDITSNLEGKAQFNHHNGADFSAENTGTVSALYKFGPRWGVNGTVEFNGEGNEIYTLGVSAAF